MFDFDSLELAESRMDAEALDWLLASRVVNRVDLSHDRFRVGFLSAEDRFRVGTEVGLATRLHLVE